MTIYAFAGPAGSGKSTAAEMLRDELGADTARLFAFADTIKWICEKVFQFTDEQLRGDLKNEPDLRYPRWHGVHESEPLHGEWPAVFRLQRLGTEWARECYPDIWAEAGLREAREFARPVWTQNGPNGLRITTDPVRAAAWPRDIFPVEKTERAAAITDCRFENEARLVRKADGYVVWMERRADGLVGKAAQHASEREMHEAGFQALVTHRIRNNGSLERLRRDVRRLIEETRT